MANLATLRPPPANDTISDARFVVTALRLDDGYGSPRHPLPGYVAGKILSVVRSATSIENGSVRRLTVDFSEDSIESAVNVEVVASRMGEHGELSRFRLLHGTRIVATGTAVIDTDWPAPQAAAGYLPLISAPLSERLRRVGAHSGARFLTIDSSPELARLGLRNRRGGHIRFRDARAINAPAIAELCDGWTMLSDGAQRGSRAHCTSITLDFRVPLATRSWDRLRFMRVEQQSDELIQGAIIEHGSVATFDGEQLVDFQRVVTRDQS